MPLAEEIVTQAAIVPSTSRSDDQALPWLALTLTPGLGTTKARRLVELHPDVQIKVLYQRDYLQLLVKYGLEPPSQLADGTGPAKLDLFPEPQRGSGPTAESA